ncbi:hypothetical protein SalAn1F4_09370 [Streptococcus alactolyticus]|nr:hypothetical protein SalAn1F4_09370 [Streptococcus alactolyticus]
MSIGGTIIGFMAVSITKHQWLFDSSLRKTLYKNCTEKCCLFNKTPPRLNLGGVLVGNNNILPIFYRSKQF